MTKNTFVVQVTFKQFWVWLELKRTYHSKLVSFDFTSIFVNHNVSLASSVYCIDG